MVFVCTVVVLTAAVLATSAVVAVSGVKIMQAPAGDFRGGDCIEGALLTSECRRQRRAHTGFNSDDLTLVRDSFTTPADCASTSLFGTRIAAFS